MLRQTIVSKSSLVNFTLKKYLVFSFSTDQLNKTHTPKQQIDSDSVINQKVKILAQVIQKSKNPTFFTGAGISTSLGIPDYRSGQNTIIKTGPGLWNRSQSQLKQMHNQQKHKLQKKVDMVIPSLSHMSIHTLIKNKKFKHLTSQNTDGLHLRSGINKNNLSQLHGNRNLQNCISCKKTYLRDFRTLRQLRKQYKPGQKRQHFTGRYCQNCNGQLHDSIIYFGESLNKNQLNRSITQSSKSDLCLSIGSSLTVKPSSTIPTLPLKYNLQGKLVIINIQQTPLDRYALLKINGFCDHVMDRLMHNLGIKIMQFRVQRYLLVSVLRQYDMWLINISGIDQHHDYYSFIKNIIVTQDCHTISSITNQHHKGQQSNQLHTNQQSKQESDNIEHKLINKFQFKLSSTQYENTYKIQFNIQFFGHFLPNLNLKIQDFVRMNQVIGKEQIMLKIVSTNNTGWQIFKTN